MQQHGDRKIYLQLKLAASYLRNNCHQQDWACYIVIASEDIKTFILPTIVWNTWFWPEYLYWAAKSELSYFKNQVSLGHWLNHVSFYLYIIGMPCLTTRNNSRRLVSDTKIRSNYALFGKLNGALSLDSGHNCIHILRNNITSVYQTTGHVLASACKLLCEVATGLLRRKLLLSKPFPRCLLCKTSLTKF